MSTYLPITHNTVSLNHTITQDGTVQGIRYKTPLEGYIDATGYIRFTITSHEGKVHYIHLHRALALSFLPGWFPGAVVNHKDGDKLNNNLSNLEWIDSWENIRHAHKLRLISYRRRPVEGYNESHSYKFKSIREAANALGLYHTNISNVLAGRSKTAGKLKWRYIDA